MWCLRSITMPGYRTPARCQFAPRTGGPRRNPARLRRAGRLRVGDALRELGAAALELYRGVSPLALLIVDPPLDQPLLELEEVELHRLPPPGLPLRLTGNPDDYRNELLILTRQAARRILQVLQEPIPDPPHHRRRQVLRGQPLQVL